MPLRCPPRHRSTSAGCETCPPEHRYVKKTNECAPCAPGTKLLGNSCLPTCDGLTPPGTASKCVSAATTAIGPRTFGRETEVSRFLPHGAFNFTSPNAVGEKRRGTPCVEISVEAIRKKDTKTQKRGERYVKKVPLPYACPIGTKFVENTGHCSDGSEPTINESCGPRSAPCATARQTCPVQFVFKGGEAHLRFCGKKRGQPAPLVKVGDDPVRAQQLARNACAAWESSTKRNAKGQVTRPGRYTPEVYAAPLGGVRRR